MAFVLMDIRSTTFSAWCAVCLIVEYLEPILLNGDGRKY